MAGDPHYFVFESTSVEFSIYFHGNFHLLPGSFRPLPCFTSMEINFAPMEANLLPYFAFMEMKLLPWKKIYFHRNSYE